MIFLISKLDFIEQPGITHRFFAS